MQLIRTSLKGLGLLALALIVVTALSAAPTHAQGQAEVWTVEYYDNLNLTGSPVYSEVIGPELDLGEGYLNWEWANAHSELGPEWSARFTLISHLDAGNYSFRLMCSDGCRMYLNSYLLFDQWEGQYPTWYDQRVLPIPARTYTFTVDYFSHHGTGVVSAAIEPTEQDPSVPDANFTPPTTLRTITTDGQGGGPMPSAPIPPAPPGQQTSVWTAEYFDNVNLEGTPFYTETIGPFLEAEWGWQWEHRFPELVDTGWSARFTLVTYLQEGNYKFNLSANDGGRLYINGILILDQWEGGYPTWHQLRLLRVAAGWHVITVEFNNRYGIGRVSAPIDPTTDAPSQHDLDLIITPASTSLMPDGQGGGPMPSVGPAVTSVQLPAGGVAADQDNPKAFISSGYMNWRWLEGGYAGNYVYTPNGETEMTMWGRWNYIFPQAGYYDVYTYIPVHVNATTNARYRVFHDNTLSPVITVNQATHGNQWVYLGSFYFQAGGAQYVYLNDLTFEADGRYDVVFDAVAFVPGD